MQNPRIPLCAVAAVIEAQGGSPQDLVSMIICTSAIAAFRQNEEPIGEAYRAVFGKHYPPMALIGISELQDPQAMVELVCAAVLPRPN